MNWLVVYLVVFAIQYVLSYGITLGYFQGYFPGVRGKCDVGFALGFSILIASIPGMVLIPYLLSGFAKYGLSFKYQAPDESLLGKDIFGVSR